MLARVKSNQHGIVDYLVNGNKSGRELSRDELDLRVCIDGDLNLTDSIINQMNMEGRTDNYLHITLSYRERDISKEKIIESYEQYKSLLMTAFDYMEYNIYAEIHFPKVKSYIDKSSEELVERFPHVHIVLPKINLVTLKSLNPFGRYKDNIDYHDSIQETVNRTHELESPYDNQRKYRILGDNSEFISRYKGDNFSGSNKEIKAKILSLIIKNNIRSMSVFEHELSKIGHVSKGRYGEENEYFQVKLPGHKRNVRLKNPCFTKDYIEDRVLLKEKPSDKKIEKKVADWVNFRSLEIKYVHPDSPKNRKIYYSLTLSDKISYLSEVDRNFKQSNNIDSKKEINNYQSKRKETKNDYSNKKRRWANSDEYRSESITREISTRIRDSMPSLPECNVDVSRKWVGRKSPGLLHGDKDSNLGRGSKLRNNKLRWPLHDRRRRLDQGLKFGIKYGVKGISRSKSVSDSPPKSIIEQYILSSKGDNSYIKNTSIYKISKRLDPERLLDYFHKKNGLIKSNYYIDDNIEGETRIVIDSKSFNISDFCTKHMHLNWKETKSIIYKLHQEQNKDQNEKHVLNSIIFSSEYVTSPFSSKAKKLRVNESIRIFNYLLKKEKLMALNDIYEKYKSPVQQSANEISDDSLSFKEVTDHYQRQQILVKQLSLKLSDIVATKDIKEKYVDFSDKNTGIRLFRDVGNKIVMNSVNPDVNHVAAAMVLAAEKFGTIKISGSKEFKQQVVDVAVAKNLNVVFKDREMQDLFIKCKEESRNNELLKEASKQYDTQLSKGKVKETEQTEQIEQTEQTEQINSYTKAAKEIKEGLLYAEKIKKDFNTIDELEPTQLRGLIDRHLKQADILKGGAGYKLVDDAIKECSDHNSNYEELLTLMINERSVSETFSSNEQISDIDEQLKESQQTKFLVNHGSAPYLFDDDNEDSYFVELSNGEIFWGVGLKDAISESNAVIGDVIELNRVGHIDVSVRAKEKDDNGNTIGFKTIQSKRIKWDVKVTGTQLDDIKRYQGDVNEKKTELSDHEKTGQNIKELKVEYKRTDNETLSVLINGQSPNLIQSQMLETIRKEDNFLKNFSLEQIQSGKIDQKEANGIPPVSKTYDTKGNAIHQERQQQTKSSKLTK